MADETMEPTKPCAVVQVPGFGIALCTNPLSLWAWTLAVGVDSRDVGGRFSWAELTGTAIGPIEVLFEGTDPWAKTHDTDATKWAREAAQWQARAEELAEEVRQLKADKEAR